MEKIWDDFCEAQGKNGVVMTLRAMGSSWEKWCPEMQTWTPVGWRSDFGGEATRLKSWSEERGVTEKLLSGEAE